MKAFLLSSLSLVVVGLIVIQVLERMVGLDPDYALVIGGVAGFVASEVVRTKLSRRGR
jgi:hypothetical protein